MKTFNVIVTSDSDAWDGTEHEFQVDRFLERSPAKTRELFAPLGASACKKLCTLRTLFAYEEKVGKPAQMGALTAVRRQDRNIQLAFQIDPRVDPIPPHELRRLSKEFGIPNFDLDRTHWEIVALPNGQARDRLRPRLDADDMRTLNCATEEYFESRDRLPVTCKKLRASMPGTTAERNIRLASLDDYLEVDVADVERCRPTPLGALVSNRRDRIRFVLDAAFLVFKKKFQDNPDFESFTLNELRQVHRELGRVEPLGDGKFVNRVFELLRVCDPSPEISPSWWNHPSEIEDVVQMESPDAFASFLAKHPIVTQADGDKPTPVRHSVDMNVSRLHARPLTGAAGGNVDIRAGDGGPGGDGGSINVRAGDGGHVGNGGSVAMRAGDGHTRANAPRSSGAKPTSPLCEDDLQLIDHAVDFVFQSDTHAAVSGTELRSYMKGDSIDEKTQHLARLGEYLRQETAPNGLDHYWPTPKALLASGMREEIRFALEITLETLRRKLRTSPGFSSFTYGDVRSVLSERDHPHHEGHEEFLARIYWLLLLCGPGLSKGGEVHWGRPRDVERIVTLSSADELVALMSVTDESKQMTMVTDSRAPGPGAASAATSAPSQAAPQSDVSDRFDIVVICALPMELQRLKAAGNVAWIPLAPSVDDHQQYAHAEYQTDGGKVSIVASCASQMGMVSAAIVSTKMILRFRPKLVAMVGIAAGTRGSDRDLGDILCPRQTFDSGAGKLEERDGKTHLSPDPNPIDVLQKILSAVSGWSESGAALDAIRRRWQGPKQNTVLKLHVGPLASGAAVVDAQEPVSEITGHWRKLVGLEMEAHGVHCAAREVMGNPVPFLCFKSICDFATDKTDGMQPYAAFTAAQAFHDFIVANWARLHLG